MSLFFFNDMCTTTIAVPHKKKSFATTQIALGSVGGHRRPPVAIVLAARGALPKGRLDRRLGGPFALRPCTEQRTL